MRKRHALAQQCHRFTQRITAKINRTDECVRGGTKNWMKFRFIFCSVASLCLTTLLFMFILTNEAIIEQLKQIELAHVIDIQRRHFRPPPSNTSHPAFVAGTPLAVDPTRAAIHPVRGFIYNSQAKAKKIGYVNLRAGDLDRWRKTSPFEAPKSCADPINNTAALLEFRGVWLDEQGNVLVPERTENGRVVARHYSMGGGCCERDWRTERHASFRAGGRCRYKVGFSLAQNHGTTPWHVLWEMLPRLLNFWNTALGVVQAGGVIVIPNSDLPQRMLFELGIRRRSIARFPDLCYFDRLFVPEPFTQGRYPPKECVHMSISKVLRSIFLSNMPPLPEKPIVLLVDRAKYRWRDRCTGNRCIGNLPQLATAIRKEFGNAVRLEIFRANARDIMRTGARMFNRATVVYGMHGAGFSNTIYMRGNGTTVLHLGWKGAWTLYSRVADMHSVTFRNIITDGAGQDCNSVKADIPVAILEIRRALVRAGYQLPPPVIATSPERNYQVVKSRWHPGNRSMT